MMAQFDALLHLPPPSYGEAARRSGGGMPWSGHLQISDLKIQRSPVLPSPSAPYGGTSPV